MAPALAALLPGILGIPEDETMDFGLYRAGMALLIGLPAGKKVKQRAALRLLANCY